LAFPIDFDRRPYNTHALPCECVIIVTFWYSQGSSTLLEITVAVWNEPNKANVVRGTSAVDLAGILARRKGRSRGLVWGVV